MKIIVVGAGIGGLAVARALQLRGAEVTVLEQAGAIREVGAGLQISPNGYRVLDALGLGERLRRVSVRAEAVQLIDYRGAPVVRLDLSGLASRDYYFVHRADLIDCLAEGARAAGVRPPRASASLHRRASSSSSFGVSSSSPSSFWMAFICSLR